jgi:hypothetical protein
MSASAPAPAGQAGACHLAAGPGPAACFMPAVTGRGARGSSPLFLSSVFGPATPGGHDPGQSATGNSLSGGDGVDTREPHYVIKVRNDGAIIYQ